MIRILGVELSRRGYVLGLRQPSVVYRLQVPTVLPHESTVGLSQLSTHLGDQFNTEGVAHQLAYWTGALQRQCRIPVSPHFVIQKNLHAEKLSHDEFFLVLPQLWPLATECALQGLVKIVNGFSGQSNPLELGGAIETICQQLEQFTEPSANAYSIWFTADALGLPVSRLIQDVLVVGQGVRARWLKSTLTDQTSAIGASLAHDKLLTAALLRKSGLPGAVHERAKSPEDAVKIAHRLGYPVVIKPADQEQGKGVAADLRTDSQVIQAFEHALSFSKRILVERHQAGSTHRLTVLHGQVFRVTQRIAGGITGDGVHTIRELVDRRPHQPEQMTRTRGRANHVLRLDSEALDLLHQQGRSPDEIPALNEYVRLRRRDNINAGGRNVKWALQDIHPDNIQLAQDAANLLRLDVAGVDLIITDISKSWRDVGAVICEVNAQPQLGMNTHAEAYPEFLNSLFPKGAHIPVHLLLCPESAAQDAQWMEALAQKTRVTGVSGRSGLLVDGVWRGGPFSHGFDAALALLQNPHVSEAICLMSFSELMQFGLPSHRIHSASVDASDAWVKSERKLIKTAEMLISPHLVGSDTRIHIGFTSLINK